MRIAIALLLIISSAFISPAPEWGHNYNEAIQKAQKEHKFILLNFSGSDWCGPCIKLHKEVFVMDDFIYVANNKLVLLNADFPRYKKNQLPAALQKINDELADKYNSKGFFPLTVLLDEDGKEIKHWEGFPASTTAFIADIQQTIQDHSK
jgi:thiol-disulfide isomerase/thioredoxin